MRPRHSNQGSGHHGSRRRTIRGRAAPLLYAAMGLAHYIRPEAYGLIGALYLALALSSLIGH